MILSDSFSIGIIGGADGPTKIYVSGLVNWPKVIVLLAGFAIFISLGIVLFRKKHSKK